MNPITTLRREIRQTRGIPAIVGAAVGMITALAVVISGAGGQTVYYIVTRPRGAPPTFLLVTLWTLVIALSCAAFAITFCEPLSCRCIGGRMRAAAFFSLSKIAALAHITLFFGGRFVFSLLLVFASVTLLLLAIRELRRTLLLSTAALGVFALWLLYAAWLNVCILILN